MPPAAEPIVYRPGGRSRAIALTAGPILVLVGLALTATGTLSGLILVLIGALPITTLRQRAVLTDRNLTVQGRFTKRYVELSQVRDAHEDRTHCAWLAAEGQAPFRVYFARPAPSSSDPDTAFVPALRRLAAARGARVDVDSDLVAAPPKGTSPLFSL